jgi:cytoskeletal protein CcmA (bactofilin family)
VLLSKKTEEAVRLFNRGSNVGPSAVQPATAAQRRSLALVPRAIIDAGLNIEGDLQTEGEVEVDGKIIGDIGCTHLTIGRDATITGNIKADEVLVRGKVRGTIRATRVILQDSAYVEGDIYHDRIVIEDGARFIGASNAKTEMTELVGKLQDVAAEELHDGAVGIHSPPEDKSATA